MLVLFFIFSIFLKSKCFTFVGKNSRNNVIFFSRLFERDDFIRQDIKRNNELLMDDNEETNFNVTESKNITIRSGRSLDQDGKTNIWSIEPTMFVEESKDKNTFKLLGILCGVILIMFQIFLSTNSLFPDPSEY
jgi:hypothetical protein